MIEASEKELQRLGMAALHGWSFRDFKFNSVETQRHSVWVMEPDHKGWFVAKVSADIITGWVGALLDEVGVS